MPKAILTIFELIFKLIQGSPFSQTSLLNFSIMKYDEVTKVMILLTFLEFIIIEVVIMQLLEFLNPLLALILLSLQLMFLATDREFPYRYFI